MLVGAQALRAEVLVVHFVCHFLQILHVRTWKTTTHNVKKFVIIKEI